MFKVFLQSVFRITFHEKKQRNKNVYLIKCINYSTNKSLFFRLYFFKYIISNSNIVINLWSSVSKWTSEATITPHTVELIPLLKSDYGTVTHTGLLTADNASIHAFVNGTHRCIDFSELRVPEIYCVRFITVSVLLIYWMLLNIIFGLLNLNDPPNCVVDNFLTGKRIDVFLKNKSYSHFSNSVFSTLNNK